MAELKNNSYPVFTFAPKGDNGYSGVVVQDDTDEEESNSSGFSFAPKGDVSREEPAVTINNSSGDSGAVSSGFTFAPKGDSFNEAPTVVSKSTEEVEADPTSSKEIELDDRLQEIYNRDIESIRKSARDYQADAVEGVQQNIDQYNIMVASAKAEDARTGGQRALMIPKPESLKRVQMIEEERLSKHKEKVEHVQALLDDPNPLRRAAVNKMVDSGVDINTISFVTTGADFLPVVGTALGIIDIPDNVRQATILFKDGNYGMAAALVGVSAVELLGVGYATKVVGSKVTKRVKKLTGLADQMKEIETATAASVASKVVAAKKIASENKEIQQRLILEYEKSTGKKVSTGTEGNLKLDMDLAKVGGKEIAKDVMELQQGIAARYAAIDKIPGVNTELRSIKRQEILDETGVSEQQAFTGLTEDADELVSPLLNPEKFDSIVALAAEFEKLNPNAFKNPDKSIIDSLFELTVQDKLVDNQQLTDLLSKYALNFDDYVLTVVGSGSEAGKILNKLSQIRRAGSLDVISKAKIKKMEQGQNALLKSWRRIENVRRGGMVSMVKTAARNLQSATIRAPLEALENVMDTTLLAMSNEFNQVGSSGLRALGKGATTLVSPTNWKGSTRALKRIYTTPLQSKELTEFLLKRPEFIKQHEALFDNVNEYQVATGRGSGGAADAVLSRAEDVVNALNTPNRIQEYLIRRGTFIGELERRVQREYGIDLMDALKEGKLPDLIANSSTVRPKGAATFAELIEDSTRKALDVTYAKAPDIPVFNDVANFLTRTGLTAVTTPFPRFMFNSMELMGQYSGGAFKVGIEKSLGKITRANLKRDLVTANATLKKVTKSGSKIKKAKAKAEIKRLTESLKDIGVLTKKDRQNISRNISGLVAFTAAYQYRTSGDAPADFKQINSKEGTVIDTTSQYPMRQFLWMAEAVKRLSPTAQKFFPQAYVGKASSSLMGRTDEGEGTFSDWFDYKEALETFVGTSGRTGGGNVFIEEIASLLSGQDDLVAGTRFSKSFGRAVGDYLTTWAIPITQIVELQRAQGDRPSDYSDQSSDKVPTVMGEIKRSFMQRGVTDIFNPSSEFELPAREFLFQEDRNREELGVSLGLGITQFTKDADYGEYLKRKGFTEYEVGSKSRVASIRRAETKLLRDIVPTLVEVAKEMEAEERKKYRRLPTNSPDRKKYTEEQYVNDVVVPYMSGVLQDSRAMVRGAGKDEVEPVTLALQDYANLPKQVRRYGTSQFFRDFGEGPDLNNIEDITYMIEMGKGFRKGTKISK